jgi:hypothetical protein
LVIPTGDFDSMLPFLVVKLDGVITSCNWESCFGGVPFGNGGNTVGQKMAGHTRIELLKALGDGRVVFNEEFGGWLEAVRGRCVFVLGNLVGRLNDSFNENNFHMVSYYCELIKSSGDAITVLDGYRARFFSSAA